MKGIDHYRQIKPVRDEIGKLVKVLDGTAELYDGAGRTTDVAVGAIRIVRNRLAALYAQQLCIPGPMSARIALGDDKRFEFGQHDEDNAYLNAELRPGMKLMEVNNLYGELRQKAEALVKEMNDGCRYCPLQTPECAAESDEMWYAHSELNVYKDNELQKEIPDPIPEGGKWTIQVMILREG